ncbi:30S ribosomal protein S13 [Candidatus Pacearchaeota archaeon]|nr:30S ribosomal protein S13 [Candidatus Pacearchaeota archaeon]
MATEKTVKEKAPEKATPSKPIGRRPGDEDRSETLVRIMGYDIAGSRPLYVGLTRIKGISWAVTNVICLKLKLNRMKKIQELTKDEIKKIEEYIPHMELPSFMRNRPTDPETGESGHFLGTDLEMKRDFDIKRLKEMKAYRGARHAAKQPVRGQRTRSHFRKKSMAAGMKKKKGGSA